MAINPNLYHSKISIIKAKIRIKHLHLFPLSVSDKLERDICESQKCFRVDNYASNVKSEVLLMDAAGQLLLTLRRKKWSLRKRWEALRGDPVRSEKPKFSVTKSLDFSNKTTANVFVDGSKQIKYCHYQMEGSLCKASCTILNKAGEIIAQIKRKEAKCDIMLGNDVLSLFIEAGVDQAFVMGLLIMFNQID
ncbi:protein LURP-one-related 5-like [Cryptomeria japonica]|uniref:protein LURP-one-related 5-like n=1 Tax=Cryptomeria japonica TaxID=3369 RepID=UPI0027DA5007|nr:protein LURP-one-related 5-like [Cryptomeria japonica]